MDWLSRVHLIIPLLLHVLLLLHTLRLHLHLLLIAVVVVVVVLVTGWLLEAVPLVMRLLQRCMTRCNHLQRDCIFRRLLALHRRHLHLHIGLISIMLNNIHSITNINNSISISSISSISLIICRHLNDSLCLQRLLPTWRHHLLDRTPSHHPRLLLRFHPRLPLRFHLHRSFRPRHPFHSVSHPHSMLLLVVVLMLLLMTPRVALVVEFAMVPESVMVVVLVSMVMVDRFRRPQHRLNGTAQRLFQLLPLL